MKCPRCNNVMIQDKFYGPYDSFWGWKCLICGELVDQVILENRELIRMGRVPNTETGKAGIEMGKAFDPQEYNKVFLVFGRGGLTEA